MDLGPDLLVNYELSAEGGPNADEPWPFCIHPDFRGKSRGFLANYLLQVLCQKLDSRLLVLTLEC